MRQLSAWPVVIATLFWGCGGTQNGTAHSPRGWQKPPKIDTCIDLGGIRATLNGALNETSSDGRFTPGEWIAIRGKYLDDTSTVVAVDGVPAAVEETVDGSLVVRFPRTVRPRSSVTVSVTTAWGSDSIALFPQSYLVLSDTGEGAVRFFRTADPNGEPQKLLETECEPVSLERARFHAVSRSGAFVYAAAGAKEHRGEALVARALLVIHMGEPRGPKLLEKVAFQSVDRPTAMMLNPEAGRLVLTTQTELLIFDVQNETTPTLISSTSLIHDGLSEGGYDRAVLLGDGQWAVLLDGLSNRLTVVDISNPQKPVTLGHQQMTDDEQPRIIDMAADLSDPNTLHILEGPNLRLAKEMFHRFLPKLTAALKSDGPARQSRLRSFVLENGVLRQTREVPLPPRTLPLQLGERASGAVLVNGVDFSVTSFSDTAGIGNDWKAIVNVLLSAVQLGTVLRVAQDGTVSTFAEGVSVFLSTTEVPGRAALVSLVMRPAIKKFPPGVSVKLTVDTLGSNGKREAELPLRNIESAAVLPPYDTPKISFQ